MSKYIARFKIEIKCLNNDLKEIHAETFKEFEKSFIRFLQTKSNGGIFHHSVETHYDNLPTENLEKCYRSIKLNFNKIVKYLKTNVVLI